MSISYSHTKSQGLYNVTCFNDNGYEGKASDIDYAVAEELALDNANMAEKISKAVKSSEKEVEKTRFKVVTHDGNTYYFISLEGARDFVKRNMLTDYKIYKPSGRIVEESMPVKVEPIKWKFAVEIIVECIKVNLKKMSKRDKDIMEGNFKELLRLATAYDDTVQASKEGQAS